MSDINNNNDNSRARGVGDYVHKFNDLRQRFPIIFNLIIMGVAALLIIWALLFFLSGWTHHGEEAEVPDVKGQNIRIASLELVKQGFGVELADSIYDSKVMPGTVVEQSPHPMSKVKPGRTVYLTIVAYTPKMVSVPDVVNASLRQGQSMLESAGFKKIQVLRVPSEYEDLVLGVKYNGRELRPGEKLPVTALITLEVGTGGYEEDSEGFEVFDTADPSTRTANE